MKLTSPHSFRLLTLIGLLLALFTRLLLGSYIRKVQTTCFTPNFLSSTTTPLDTSHIGLIQTEFLYHPTLRKLKYFADL